MFSRDANVPPESDYQAPEFKKNRRKKPNHLSDMFSAGKVLLDVVGGMANAVRSMLLVGILSRYHLQEASHGIEFVYLMKALTAENQKDRPSAAAARGYAYRFMVDGQLPRLSRFVRV